MPQIFRKDNIGLGATAKAWLDALQVHLLDAGWTLFDDEFTNPVATSGYRIYAPGGGLGSGNGLLEVYVDGTLTRLRCWDTWNAATNTGARDTQTISRNHDLANGFNYYLEADSNYIALIIQTTSAVNSPIVAGVKAPDSISDVFNVFSFPIPRGYVAQPDSNAWNPTHVAVLANNAAAGGNNAGSALRDWEVITGQLFSTFTSKGNARLRHNIYGNDDPPDSTYLTVSDRIVDGAVVWPLQAGVSDYEFNLSTGNADYIYAAFYHTVLPGCKKTNSPASSPVLLLVEDNYDSYFAKAVTATLGADLALAEVTSMTLAGDASYLPVSGGSVRIENEWIGYTSRSGLTLNGLSRGIFGTAAAQHVASRPLWTDDFNRADGAIGANWTANDVDAQATVTIQGNRARMNATVGSSARRFNVIATGSTVASPNAELECDYDFGAGANASNEVGLIARWQDSNNYYYVVLTANGNLQLRRVLAGVDTSLESVTLTGLGTSGTLRLTAFRTKLTAWVNGVKRLTAFDSSFTSGARGFRGRIATTANQSVFIDNFVVLRTEPTLSVYVARWYVKSQAAVLDAGAIKP
jgi:hypothetical protein